MLRRFPAVLLVLVAGLVLPTLAKADSGLTASPNPFDYGTIPAGYSYYNGASQLILTNTTNSDVTLNDLTSAFTYPDDNWSWVSVGDGQHVMCASLTPLVLHPGDSCAMVPYVVWNGSLGETTDTLTIHTDQGTSDVPVSAFFAGSVPAYVANNDSWFPQVVGPAVKSHTFYVKNVGNVPLHATSVTLVDGRPLSPSFHIIADGCTGEPIAPATTCPITVSFDGPSDWKVGTDLIVTTDGNTQLNNPTLDFSMTGVRIRLAVLSDTISAHSFTPVDANGNRHGVRYTWRSTNPAHTTLQVVNSHGLVVRSWTFKSQHAGWRSLSWLGKDNRGQYVTPGTYHFRVRLSEYHTVRFGGRERIVVRA
jgi:hypothetical protein